MKDTKKMFRVVFTLTSGKSIVYTMIEDNAFKVFDDWKKFKEGKDLGSDITEVTKTKEGQISERLGVDLTKVDALQLDDTGIN